MTGTFLSILLGTIAGGILVAIPGRGVAYVSLTLLTVAVMGLVASLLIPEAKAVDTNLRVRWNPNQEVGSEVLRFREEFKDIGFTVFFSLPALARFGL